MQHLKSEVFPEIEDTNFMMHIIIFTCNDKGCKSFSLIWKSFSSLLTHPQLFVRNFSTLPRMLAPICYLRLYHGAISRTPKMKGFRPHCHAILPILYKAFCVRYILALQASILNCQ